MNDAKLYVGIDLARRANHKAVALKGEETASPQAARSKPVSFSHDRDGFLALRDRLREQTGAASLKGVTVNLEPTSGVWETVAGFLRAQGAEVFFTRTDVVSALRKVHSKFAKTDRIDARTLAGIPRSFPERLVPVVEVEERIRTLRQLSAQRQRLVEDQTAWKNRLVAKLETAWGPLMCSLNKEQRFSQLACAFFKRFARPAKVVACGRERFLAWCKTQAHAHTDPDTFETFWQGAVESAALWSLLDDCKAIAVNWDVLHDLILQDLRLIDVFDKEIRTTEAQIRQARSDVPECDVVQQLPGVGPVVSVTLTAVLSPTTRFANTKKCGAYTGFTSRKKSSAGRDIEGLKITKTGNRRLKRDLALAADVAMHQDPQLAAFAIRLLRAGKHYNKVRVAVGRKLAVCAFSLLKRYNSGQTNVAYVWRDLQGHPIQKRQAKELARSLWDAYETQQKIKGSSPTPALPWQSENSTTQALNELPEADHD